MYNTFILHKVNIPIHCVVQFGSHVTFSCIYYSKVLFVSG